MTFSMENQVKKTEFSADLLRQGVVVEGDGPKEVDKRENCVGHDVAQSDAKLVCVESEIKSHASGGANTPETRSVEVLRKGAADVPGNIEKKTKRRREAKGAEEESVKDSHDGTGKDVSITKENRKRVHRNEGEDAPSSPSPKSGANLSATPTVPAPGEVYLQLLLEGLVCTSSHTIQEENLLFGVGTTQRLGESLNRMGWKGKKALVVTSVGCLKRVFFMIGSQLKQANVTYVVFDGVIPNPTKKIVDEGTEMAVNNGVDFVIGIGGGSSIDVAKAIVYGKIKRDRNNDAPGTKHSALPIVAIPTTAGTGSEVDTGAVITIGGQKIVIGDNSLLPQLVIVDPRLMLSVPQAQTAYQGFDALFHSIESYLSLHGDFFYGPGYPLYDKLLTVVAAIVGNLPIVVADGNNINGRTGMAFASTAAGIFEQKGLLLIHNMAHALGGRYPDLPHGAVLILLSVPFYEKFIEKNKLNANTSEKLIKAAKMLGKADASDPSAFPLALKEFKVKCQVGNLKMSDFGIERPSADDLKAFAAESIGGPDSCNHITPGGFTENDCIEIFEQLWNEESKPSAEKNADGDGTN